MGFSKSQKILSYHKSKISDLLRILAWVICKTTYSHFRSHSIPIVENYKYTKTWRYFSCSHFLKWREKLMFTLYNYVFWKFHQIVINCEHEFFLPLYKVWTWQIVLQFRPRISNSCYLETLFAIMNHYREFWTITCYNLTSFF